MNTLQVREYGPKIGDVLKATNDRQALLRTVTSTQDVLAGVPITDFQAVLRKTAVDSQFLAAVSTAKLTEPQVSHCDVVVSTKLAIFVLVRMCFVAGAYFFVFIILNVL